MPSNWLYIDTNFPTFTGEESVDKKVITIQNYMFMMVEQLRYTLHNLDLSNMNGTAVDQFSQTLLEPVYARLEDGEGNLTQLQLTAAGLAGRISDAEGNITQLGVTAAGLASRVSDAEGNISAFTQTAASLAAQISDLGGDVSALQLTAASLTSRISDAEGNISIATQTANKIDWLIASGTSASNFTMTDRAIKLVSDTIELSGYVTVSSLKTAGKSVIDGANITTGTINAARIDVNSLKVHTIYTTDGNRVAVKSTNTGTLYLAGDSTWNFDNTFIYGGSYIRFGAYGTWTSHQLVIDTQNFNMHPSTSVDWDLGTQAYPFGDIWCENIHVSGSSVAKLTNGSYTVSLTTTSALIPSSSGYALGSSSYYWATAYITKLYLSSTCYITAGSSSTIKVGSTTIGGSVPKLVNGSYSVSLGTNVLTPGTSGTYSLGSSSYHWNYLYVKTIRLYYSNYSYIDLTCNSSKKLCVDGTAIH